MPSNNSHEQQFFKALNDIFVGAKIEGESGYINLMAIKSRYYTNGVFPQLKRDVDTALAEFPEFREELFDKLYSFFQRYFSESGSIYFRHTALHQNIYEKVYTDDRDVVLFWKTHMLYYVKTDRLFKSMAVEVDEQKFWFDASQVELKKSNEKKDVLFAYREVRQDGTLVFDVKYSERGSKTREEEILQAVKKDGVSVSDETLTKAFRVFEKQSEVDYFINKDARSFLREQFDMWMYQYLFEGQNTWSAERLAQLQALKAITYKVIDFISQFEDELVKVWNKPKFVRNSHYVITLDKLIESPVFDKVLAHPKFPEQVIEWRDLGMVGDDFKVDLLTQKDLTGVMQNQRYQYLPMDTKYFPELELDILGLFENLDASLDGWLMHSENYQALISIKNKFSKKINIAYLDPPFNTSEESFIYANLYKHSSWATSIENRLTKTSDLLAKNGLVSIAIDDEELCDLKHICSEVFGYENSIGTLVIETNPRGRTINSFLATSHEYNLIYCQDIYYAQIQNLPLTGEQEQAFKFSDGISPYRLLPFRRSGGNSTPDVRPKSEYPIYYDDNTKKVSLEKQPGLIEIWPIDTKGKRRVWRFSYDESSNLREAISKDEFVVKRIEGTYTIYLKDRLKEGRKPKSIWIGSEYDASTHGTVLISELFGNTKLFSYPKSVYTIQKVISILSSTEKDNVLDFFAGSGTTAHAVMNLNREDRGKRKYVLVEMGEHFNTVILPRIKKVAFNSKWKDGKPVFTKGESGMSHFIKYYDLEQYEEVLQRAHYEDSNLFQDPNQDPYHSYVFLRDLKLLESLEIDREANRVHFHPERLYPDIDLAETLSQRRGKWIKRITKDFVEFQDGEKMSLTDPDWQTLKPMIWWQ